jgi:murein DD-endopeptidase MepM/ murein hydrolase activator NlpD
MPRKSAPSRQNLRFRIAVVAAFAVGMAGCSDSGRFEMGNPFKSDSQPQARQDVTGSVASRPAAANAVQSQPLPTVSRPQTVAAHSGGVAQGAAGLGAYRPAASGDITGSVAQRSKPATPSGHWTWEGGTPIAVAPGETVETIGRRHGVPVSAILQANGVTNPADIRSGQRLVIPRYVLNHAAPSRPAAAVAAPAAKHVVTKPTVTKHAAAVHVVEPGQSLFGIARRYGLSPSALAKANNIPPHTRVNIGDRLTIPGGAHNAATKTASSPQVQKPKTVVAAKTTQSPTESARVTKHEQPATEQVTKSVEPAGALPSFRWPVRGRVIAAFGPKTSGQQNDGINLAVPEGTPIKAAEDGVVAYAGNELKGYGNLVLIRHANGFVSAYAHAREIIVKRGDTIKRGQEIGRAGQTGNVTSPQLHFEIRKGSVPVDPVRYLAGA